MLAAAVSAIAIHAFLLLSSLLLARRKMKAEADDASLLRYFPSEYLGTRTPSEIVSTCFFVVAHALMAVPSILILLTIELMGDSLRSYIGFCISSFAISTILDFLLILVGPSKEKGHFMLFVALSFLMAVAIMTEGMTFLNLRSFSISEEWTVAFSIALFVLSAFLVFLPLNPKLRDWYRLEATTNKDGSVHYKRPKIFVLAFSEWLLYGAMSLSFLFSTASYLLICLK